MTDRQLITRELKRLKTLPTKGVFTFLHHNQPAEKTTDLWKRIDYILSDKPLEEHYDRLRQIYHIPEDKFKEYEQKQTLIWEEYEQKEKLIWEEYEQKEKLIWEEYEQKHTLIWEEYEQKEKLISKEYEQKHTLIWEPILALIPNRARNEGTILKEGEDK